MKKKPLCPAPFLGYFWKGNCSEDHTYEGRMRPCCESRPVKDSRNRTVIERSIKIKDVTENMLENEFLADIRASLMEGEYHAVCHDCKYREEMGLVNSRENYQRHADLAEKLYPELEYDVKKGNNLGKLFWLDYRPSNLCNLKCRMCGPYNSSLFAEEIMNMEFQDQDEYTRAIKTEVEGSDLYDKTNTEKLYGGLNLDDIVYLKFLGGEPLFMKEPIEMLDKVGKNAYVSFTTNATKITDSFIAKINSMDCRMIHFQISLDGINDVYEYIRAPGKWERIEKNLGKLYSLKDSKSKIHIGMTFVCQMWNAFQLPDLIRWSVRFFRHYFGEEAGRTKGPMMTMVSQKYLRLCNLTAEHKEWLRDELEHVQFELAMCDKEIKRYIEPILIQVNDEIPDAERDWNVKAFSKATVSFDKFREQNIFDIDERFVEYINDIHIRPS